MSIRRTPISGEPRYRILVVDDDPWTGKVIESALAPEMDVVTCLTGEMALRVLANGDFHVICADYRMPGMNGIELLTRAAQMYEHIGGLLVTGADAQLVSVERKNHYVLTKPFDPTRLLGVVKQLARIAEMKRSVDDGSRISSPPSSRRPTTTPPPSSRQPTAPPSSSRVSSLPSAPSAALSSFDRTRRR